MGDFDQRQQLRNDLKNLGLTHMADLDIITGGLFALGYRKHVPTAADLDGFPVRHRVIIRGTGYRKQPDGSWRSSSFSRNWESKTSTQLAAMLRQEEENRG